VSNDGREAARLVNRHWIITDARGEVEQVHGPGVVGEQPRSSRASRSSTRAAVRCRPRAFDAGNLRNVAPTTGGRFLAEIAPFALEMPHTLN